MLKTLKLQIFMIFIITSCATVKPYPVCFFGTNPPDLKRKMEIVSGLADRLRLEASEVVIHPTGRWIFAKTTPSQHKRIIKTWPRVACIGRVSSGTEISKNADCVSYLNNFLKNKQYLRFDKKENPVDSDEAPGQPHVICCTD